MSKGGRIVVPGVPHHITQRGNNRQMVFSQEADYRRYLVHLGMDMEKHGILLHGYCLMQNHFHLIVTPPSKKALSALMKISSQRYARFWNKQRDKSGHLWQNRFFSCPMDPSHMYRALRYVELNPVRAKLVTDPRKYRWSSAQFHCSPTPLKPIIALEKVAGCWEAPEWQNFLGQNDDPQDLIEIRVRTANSMPWGGRDFQKQHTGPAM